MAVEANDVANDFQAQSGAVADIAGGNAEDPQSPISQDGDQPFSSEPAPGDSRGLSATVSDAGRSIVKYTQDNPVPALLIAAASGALMFGLARTLLASRE